MRKNKTTKTKETTRNSIDRPKWGERSKRKEIKSEVKSSIKKSNKTKKVSLAFGALMLVAGISIGTGLQEEDVPKLDKIEKRASKAQEEEENSNVFSDYKKQLSEINIHEQANENEIEIFDNRKEEVETLIKNKADVGKIDAAILLLHSTNKDVQTRVDAEEAARLAEEERIAEENRVAEEKRIAEQERIEQQQAAEQKRQVEAQKSTAPDVYYCVDGTTVPGTSNPSAKGRANACYGHGGFQINH